MSIDRTVLARVRGCRDPSMLEGMACTSGCPFRSSCNLIKTPLVIPCASVRVRIHDAQRENEGIPVLSFFYQGGCRNSYLNELTGMTTTENAISHRRSTQCHKGQKI